MGNIGGLAFAAPCPSYHPLEFPGELLWVPREADQPPELGIPCLFLQCEAASCVVLYFHANAEDLGRMHSFLSLLKDAAQVHIIAVEYPGYGICSGETSPEAVIQDAVTTLAFIQEKLGIPPDRVLVMGRSIGGGPAIHLAARYICGGLVTVGTFSSVSTVVGNMVGWGGWFPHVFDNLTQIRSVGCITLLIHGKADRTVDVNQAYELAEACGADETHRPPVFLSLRDGVDHNNFDIEVDIAKPMKDIFPHLLDPEPLEYPPLKTSPARYWLRKKSAWVAPDVADRVPYSPNFIPECARGPSDRVPYSPNFIPECARVPSDPLIAKNLSSTTSHVTGLRFRE